MEDKKKEIQNWGPSFWFIKMARELRAKGVPEEEIDRIIKEKSEARKEVERQILESEE